MVMMWSRVQFPRRSLNYFTFYSRIRFCMDLSISVDTSNNTLMSFYRMCIFKHSSNSYLVISTTILPSLEERVALYNPWIKILYFCHVGLTGFKSARWFIAKWNTIRNVTLMPTKWSLTWKYKLPWKPFKLITTLLVGIYLYLWNTEWCMWANFFSP